MRIFMIGPDSTAKGGIATVIANFKNYFHYPDMCIDYLTTWQEGSKWRQLKLFFQVKKKLAKNRADVIHIHVAQKGSFLRKALIVRQNYKKSRIIMHMHASSFDIFYKSSPWFMQKWIRNTFDKADCLVVLGENWRTFYQQLTETEIKIIPNAVPIPPHALYNPQSRKIITFGRVGKRKGSYDILNIAKKLQTYDPRYQFVLYGDGDLETVQQKIRQENIENVILGGWVTVKENILQESFLHILPSYHEGLPMAILETMAAGIPNMVSDVGEIPMLIKDRENGLLIQPGNDEQMWQMLCKFIAHLEFRQSLSKHARKTIIDQYSIQAYNQAWHDLYAHLQNEETGV